MSVDLLKMDTLNRLAQNCAGTNSVRSLRLKGRAETGTRNFSLLEFPRFLSEKMYFIPANNG